LINLQENGAFDRAHKIVMPNVRVMTPRQLRDDARLQHRSGSWVQIVPDAKTY
jgi:hypothetical protein